MGIALFPFFLTGLSNIRDCFYILKNALVYSVLFLRFVCFVVSVNLWRATLASLERWMVSFLGDFKKVAMDTLVNDDKNGCIEDQEKKLGYTRDLHC